jgi:hypothetical protein
LNLVAENPFVLFSQGAKEWGKGRARRT